MTSGATSGNAIFLHNSPETFFYQIHAQIMAFKWHLVLEIIKWLFCVILLMRFFYQIYAQIHAQIMTFKWHLNGI